MPSMACTITYISGGPGYTFGIDSSYISVHVAESFWVLLRAPFFTTVNKSYPEKAIDSIANIFLL